MNQPTPIAPLTHDSLTGSHDIAVGLTSGLPSSMGFTVGPQIVLAPTTDSPTTVVKTQPKPIVTTRVWGLDFAVVEMPDVMERAEHIIQSRSCTYFITANLNYLMLSAGNADLSAVNRDADLIIADGFPVVLRSWFNPKRLPGRVAGSDMIIELARLSAERGYSIYFLGGAPGVAQKAAGTLQTMFPDLKIAGCAAPPFRPLSAAEHSDLLAEIRNAKADILLVAFGQPKGELWIHEHHQAVGVPLSIQLGASFDFLAGTAKRAPKFWQWTGCEWLYRTLHEPKRLGPRYFNNIAFLVKTIIGDLRSCL